jgi:hypothetical protein
MAFTIRIMAFHLEIIKTPLSFALLLLLLIFIAITTLYLPRRAPKTRTPSHTTPAAFSHDSKSDYYNITPLPIDLPNTQPLALRPFKPTYHMTMSLASCTFSTLLAMDSTFSSRCAIRRALIETQRYEVLACNPGAGPAVRELYEWLVGTYLPTRFPSVYETGEEGLVNKVTGDFMPATPQDADHALETLGRNIDTEFLIMLPSTSASDAGVTYRLQAFINTFPSGFSTRAKLGHTLAHIHAPVPGYAQKLQKSMDRYFAALPAGKIIQRANWSVSTSGQLFCLSGNHMAADDVGATREQDEDVDLKTTVLRCERQTLHRLPGTGALVFAFVSNLLWLIEVVMANSAN